MTLAILQLHSTKRFYALPFQGITPARVFSNNWKASIYSASSSSNNNRNRPFKAKAHSFSSDSSGQSWRGITPPAHGLSIRGSYRIPADGQISAIFGLSYVSTRKYAHATHATHTTPATTAERKLSPTTNDSGGRTASFLNKNALKEVDLPHERLYAEDYPLEQFEELDQDEADIDTLIRPTRMAAQIIDGTAIAKWVSYFL